MKFIVTVEQTPPADYLGLPPHLRSTSSLPSDPPPKADSQWAKNLLIFLLAFGICLLGVLWLSAKHQVTAAKIALSESMVSLTVSRQNLATVSQDLLACQESNTLNLEDLQDARKKTRVLEEKMELLKVRTSKLVADSLKFTTALALAESQTIYRVQEVVDSMLFVGKRNFLKLVAGQEPVFQRESADAHELKEPQTPWWLTFTDFEAFCLSVMIASPIVGICTLLKVRYKRKQRTRLGRKGLFRR